MSVDVGSRIGSGHPARLAGGRARPATPGRPHAYYLAIAFPPAAKSSAYRMRETANQLYAHGWDVTVVTIRQESWERDFGLDHTLSEAVHPAIRIVELPLARADLETDIRKFSEKRSRDPQAWIRQSRVADLEVFPEMVFGSWRPVLEEAMLWLHGQDPADLLLTTCPPYVGIAATLRLWDEAKVPYAVDFRDGWSIDVIGGGEAFTTDAPAGRWESRLLRNAAKVWVVNEPIAQHYRDRYPDLSDKIEVVRNGFDADNVPAVARTRPGGRADLRISGLGQLQAGLPGRDAGRLEAGTQDRPVGRQVAAGHPRAHRRRFGPRGHRAHRVAASGRGRRRLVRRASAEREGRGDLWKLGRPGPDAGRRSLRDVWQGLRGVGQRVAGGCRCMTWITTRAPFWRAARSGPARWASRSSRWPENIRQAARMALASTPEQRAEARRLGSRFERTAQTAPAVARLTAAVSAEGSHLINVLVIAVAVPGRPAAFANPSSDSRLRAHRSRCSPGSPRALPTCRCKHGSWRRAKPVGSGTEGEISAPCPAGPGAAPCGGQGGRAGRAGSPGGPYGVAARPAASRGRRGWSACPRRFGGWRSARPRAFGASLRRVLLIGPALEVTKQAVRGRAKRYGRAAAFRGTGARVQRTGLGRAAWQSALRAPLPEKVRLPLARLVADGLTRAGYAEQAGSTVTGVARNLPQQRRARFLADSANAELAAGRTPPYLSSAVAAELATADAALASGQAKPAAAAVQRAAELMFHRVALGDRLTPPAAPDLRVFFAPWFKSTTVRALGAPRRRSSEAAPLPADRPLRLLFVPRLDVNGLTATREHDEQHLGVEVRCLDTPSDDRLKAAAEQPRRFYEHVLGVNDGLGDEVEAALRPHLDWADIVFVDGWAAPAALLSLVDPGTARVIVRLHSLQVFTAWPQVTDLSRVDDVVVASDHLRDDTSEVLPHLTERTRTWVIPDAMDPSADDRPKPASDRADLGVVGMSSVAHDPRWAFEVLRLLRAEDDRRRP